MMDESVVLYVKANDGKTFSVKEEIARQSIVFHEMLDNMQCSVMRATEEEPFPCDSEGITLEKALEWMEHHKQDFSVPDEDDLDFKEKELGEWDAKFFKEMETEQLCELIRLANFLNTKNLLVHTAKAIASLMSGKSTEEMRSIVMHADDLVNIENDDAEEKDKEEGDIKIEEKEEVQSSSASSEEEPGDESTSSDTSDD